MNLENLELPRVSCEDGGRHSVDRVSTWISRDLLVCHSTRRAMVLVALSLLGLGPVLAFAPAARAEGPKSREFLFTYQATLTGLKPGQGARVWLPVPPSNAEQEVTVVKEELPAKGELGKEPKYGNRVLYVEAMAGREGTITLAVA